MGNCVSQPDKHEMTDEYQPRTNERLVEILRAQDQNPRSWQQEAADAIERMQDAMLNVRGYAAMQITQGSRVTTRYFGGYEAVIVRQIHPTYFVVARMDGKAKNLDGGEATDILPKDQVEKVTA